MAHNFLDRLAENRRNVICCMDDLDTLNHHQFNEIHQRALQVAVMLRDRVERQEPV